MYTLPLSAGQKVYFASDFHLGAPDAARSREREQTIVRWLDVVSADAAAIFLVGDLFDFWYEYRRVVPRGHVRFLGKLAELTDGGLDVRVFTGNHDMWMRDYFPDELGVKVYRQPRAFQMGDRRVLVAHGDGLGPGDQTYKVLKRLFKHPLSRCLFGSMHPDWGIAVADAWSRHSRANQPEEERGFMADGECLLQYCRAVEVERHHDYYVFGHRHLPLDLPVGERSRYVNLGEWISARTYGAFDGAALTLKTFEG
ncbi:MAG: UDP-2,3-diacylglucosamine diphosphatase [Catalinimonas sp.]